MSKEIYISSTPHETRLAIVENDALTEIYYERENEYTLAGSIYNGKVTRVLPGMQSSFVDIGLERDAFLYITDFMEEAPDSAEFDTTSLSDGPSRDRVPKLEAQNGSVPRAEAPRSDRGDRNDRGDRGRGRGRGDRGNRQPAAELPRPDAEPEYEAPRQTAPAEIPSIFAAQQPSAPEDNELGEGAPGADGSRRWRGRRGRRRGRGPNGTLPGNPTAEQDESPRTTSAGGEQPVFAEESSTTTPVSSYQPDIYANEAIVELEAGTEAPRPDPAPQTEGRSSARSERGGGRDRGGRDRGGRGDRNRDSRGGRERSDGSDARPARIPRGFAPSANLYGVDESPFAESSAPVEPIILPGESLSKYRKGGEPEPAAATGTVAAPAPSTEFTIQGAWDGGATLPGESLSRHRRTEPRPDSRPDSRPEPRAEVRTEPRIPFMRPVPPVTPAAPRSEATPKIVHEADGPSVAPIPETQPEVALAAHPELVPSVDLIHEPSAPQPAAEYEPEEASASFRVDTTRSEYRQPAPVLDAIAEPQPETKPASLEETTFGHTHFLTPEPSAPESPHVEEPVLDAMMGQVVEFDPIPAPALEPTTGTTLPNHDIVTLHASGEMHSEALPEMHAPADLIEEHAGTFEEEEQPASQTFAPGSGDLEEEVMDDDEFEITALHAGYEDDMEDMEEETLEGAADLGTMIREMSIDQITRPAAPAEDDEGEDFEEDFLEESEEAGTSEHNDTEDMDEDSEEYARTAEAIGDFSNEFREPAPATPTEGTASNERRGGRQNVRRGGRDREPRRGSDSSGRPRNMGGSGDRERGRSGGRSSAQMTNLPAISDLLKPGQEILVQIAKEPIAKKGARITSHIALPGRFLVFMPTVNHTGVSRKIESDGERRRLKEILLSEKGEAAGGFIVRTAASGATEEELRSDLRFLLNLWADIKNRSESSKSPALIYHDLNLVERILRDQVTDNFSAIWVDTETEYERVLRFLQRFQPALIRRVKLYLKETPLFEQFGITEEINKALRSKVWLKSGGSIVINQTEALVAIDINTGKFVGKTARLEDTIVKTNLDAIPEIVRQIRLRDLGGIIIIDFIDMDDRRNRNKVMAALEEELKSDRAPSKVLQFNDFGLVAITRKRVKQSLERTLSTTCNVCVGTGMVKSPVTVCNDIYIEMRKMYKHLDKGDVMLRVHPEVVKQLKSTGTRWLQEMEEMSGKTILVKSDPALHPEQFDIH